MNIVLYLGAAFFAGLTIVALSGRTTVAIYGVEPGYFAWKKINADDPNRMLYMVTQAIINMLVSLGCLGLGLYRDNIVVFPKELLTPIAVGYFVIIIVISVVYATKVKRQKPASKKRTAQRSPPSIKVGDLTVIYGVTTPKVFDGTGYTVAYDTVVQEAEIPFITCELLTAQDRRYIGDILFEAADTPLSEPELQSRPIIQIHLDESLS